ncbi:FBD-associated F-box protein At5g56370-like [Trifolium pratense]|uniref:FBD-associated F-box protein At5g56370-like n=1 Tax=Trifolium pratense TaxID=57577 RepID=UPI001E698359|nr:FBD-associated F-box protein At5g56370-like [Trifolium pratense]
MSGQQISADRLSSLPDDILIHILSFLPTKQSIIASILSKRWIHLWRSVPVLNFLDTKVNNQQDNYRFNQFINTNFLSPEASAASGSIHTFFLGIHYDHSKLDKHDRQISLTYINNWIKHVVECNNVQYLSLHLPLSYRFASTIISSTTLVVLKLQTIYMDEVSPSSSRFPSLKTLHLNDIIFNKYSDFMLFLDGCPVLENLEISFIYIKSINQSDFEHFESSSSLTKLNKAYIEGCGCHFPMKLLSYLKFLHIQLSKDIYTTDVYDFPTFHNLTHLVLQCDWDIVVQVLQHCPKLQNFELYQNLLDRHTYTKDDNENWADPDFVPHCLSLNLTTCAIGDFAFAGLQMSHYVSKIYFEECKSFKNHDNLVQLGTV